MEAKDKAKELVEKFTDIENKYLEYTDHIQAKQCALVCVDEIISACEFNNVETHNTDWWNKVKQEINNL